MSRNGFVLPSPLSEAYTPRSRAAAGTPEAAQPPEPPSYSVRTHLLARKERMFWYHRGERSAAPGGAARPCRRMLCSSVGGSVDPDQQKPARAKLADAIGRYEEKFGRTPRFCLTSPPGRRRAGRTVPQVSRGTAGFNPGPRAHRPAGPSTLEKMPGRLRRAPRSAPRHDLQADCAQRSGSLLLELSRAPRAVAR